MRMEDIKDSQKGLLSPVGASFKRIMQEIACHLHDYRLKNEWLLND